MESGYLAFQGGFGVLIPETLSFWGFLGWDLFFWGGGGSYVFRCAPPLHMKISKFK